MPIQALLIVTNLALVLIYCRLDDIYKEMKKR